MLQKDIIVPPVDFSVNYAAEVPGHSLGWVPGLLVSCLHSWAGRQRLGFIWPCFIPRLAAELAERETASPGSLLAQASLGSWGHTVPFFIRFSSPPLSLRVRCSRTQRMLPMSQRTPSSFPETHARSLENLAHPFVPLSPKHKPHLATCCCLPWPLHTLQF